MCRVTPQKASNPTYRDYFWIIPDHGMLNKDYPHGLCTAGGHKEVLKVLWMLLDYLISCQDSFQQNIESEQVLMRKLCSKPDVPNSILR